MERHTTLKRWLIVLAILFALLCLTVHVLMLLPRCASPNLPSGPVATLPPPPIATVPPAEVEPEALRPMPTALPAPAHLFLSLSSSPLHGPPPLTVGFSSHLNQTLPEDKACQAARWHFGDGTEETLPCPPAESAYHFEARHTYTRTGTYHPKLTLTLADGEQVTSFAQAIVVGAPQPEPWSARMLRWGTWGLSLLGAAGALMWLRQRPRRWKVGGYALLALGLLTFVPPFSWLPDPLGLYWGVRGGYRHDPRLPFADRFVIARDPTADLQPYLDGLIGAMGLDPLDPSHPLERYQFLRVIEPAGLHGIVQVCTRMVYEGGESRVYDIPLSHASSVPGGFYQSSWRYDGLGRLRTEHRSLPEAPFAGPDAPVRLEVPVRLDLHPSAQTLGADTPDNWLFSSIHSRQRLALSPQGDQFLWLGRGDRYCCDLYLVPLDDGRPRLVAENVSEYTWSPDGAYIVFLTRPPAALHAADGDGGNVRLLASNVGEALPGVTSDRVFYEQYGTVWAIGYGDDGPQRLFDLPAGLAAEPGGSVVIAPTVNGKRLAVAAAKSVGIVALDGTMQSYLPETGGLGRLRYAAWSPGETRLALAYDGQGGQTDDQPTRLVIVSADGALVQQVDVAPHGKVGPPLWTPDGRHILIQTFPFDGRRIVAVDAASGQALDLSQYRWDTYFDLLPGGDGLLLGNGRGGFWTVALETS